MNSQILSWFSFFLLVLFRACNGSSITYSGEFYQNCGNTFTCGDTATGIGYPFRGLFDPLYCGYPSLVLACEDQQNSTSIYITKIKYRVLEINQTSQTMRIAREDLMGGTCPEMMNTTLDYSLFDYAAAYTNFTFLYGCPPDEKIPDSTFTSCGNGGQDGVHVVPGNRGPGNCNASVIVPGPVTGNASAGDEFLRQGFLIKWKIDGKTCSDCTASKGRCGFNYVKNQTTCFCPDPPFLSDTCSVSYEASPVKKPSSGTFFRFFDFLQ